jgi:hypothetical protein
MFMDWIRISSSDFGIARPCLSASRCDRSQSWTRKPEDFSDFSRKKFRYESQIPHLGDKYALVFSDIRLLQSVSRSIFRI